MTLEQFWISIQPALVDLIIAILGALSIFIINWMKSQIDVMKSKTDNEAYKVMLDQAYQIIANCVKATNQTYVDSLKKSGQFTKESQQEAFEKTKDAVMNALSQSMIEAIAKTTGNFDIWLQTAIESAVADAKPVDANTVSAEKLAETIQKVSSPRPLRRNSSKPSNNKLRS